MKQNLKKKRLRARRRLMRKIRFNQMLGGILLDIPWIERTSPLIMHFVRVINAYCVELERLKQEGDPSDDQTAA